jgi:hypothetical protein
MADPILRTTCNFHGKCTDLLHAAKLRHGTDGSTSPPKEGMLRIFFARKIRRLQPGLNPRTRVPEASVLTTRPLKPLKAGRNCVFEYYLRVFLVSAIRCCLCAGARRLSAALSNQTSSHTYFTVIAMRD